MKKVPSLLKIKEGVTKEIKKRDPKAKPKLTKVGLFDLMSKDDQDDLRLELFENEGPMGSPRSPNYGYKNAYKKAIKRLAIEWFKRQRKGN